MKQLLANPLHVKYASEPIDCLANGLFCLKVTLHVLSMCML